MGVNHLLSSVSRLKTYSTANPLIMICVVEELRVWFLSYMFVSVLHELTKVVE